MDLLGFLRAMARSWWLILIALVAGGVGGYVTYHRATPLYSASVQIGVAIDAPGTDEVSARQLSQLRAQTLAQAAITDPALNAAVDSAGVGRGGGLSVSANSVGSVVSVQVVNTSPRIAAAVASGYPGTLNASANQVFGTSGTRFSLNVVIPAVVPADPFEPDELRDVGFGLAAGLVLGLAFALIREMTNRSLRDSEQVRAATDLEVLGTVPRRTQKVLLPALSDPRGARAEAYRQVRTTLLRVLSINVAEAPQVSAASRHAHGPDGELRGVVVAVTSATLGEGKTSVACNLAVVLVKAGLRVAIVDADMRRPRVGDMFGVTQQPGLSDVLNGTASLTEAVRVNADRRLLVLPSGRRPANPAELLTGSALTDVLEDLRGEVDVVLVDTPPVLPVSDGREVASVVDATVLVVKINGPSADRVRRAVASLKRVGATLVGVVPNQAGRGVDGDYRYAYRYSLGRREHEGKSLGDIADQS